MKGAEQKPGEPVYQQFKAGLPGNGFGEQSGSVQQGNAVHTFNSFLESLAPRGERRQGYGEGQRFTHPFDAYALMEGFNSRFEDQRWNELGFHPTEEQNQMVYRVRLAYGILVHPFSIIGLLDGRQSTAYQETIETHIALDRVRNGNTRIVLTDPEREILVKISKAAGIPCDPEKKEYFYSEIPQTTLHHEDLYRTPKVVDADY